MVTGDAASGALRRAVAAEDVLGARRLLDAVPVDDGGTLDELAHLAAAGGPGATLAVELLLERLDASGVVRRFVAGALLDHAAVDDVTQDTLVSVAASLASFSGSSRVTTWVHTIARHRVVDHLRRQRAAAPLPPGESGPAERMSSMIATRATVQALLAGLPDHYREPVTLRDVEGLPYEEVAARLQRPVGTVKAQVSRGRALVAAALREPVGGGR